VDSGGGGDAGGVGGRVFIVYVSLWQGMAGGHVCVHGRDEGESTRRNSLADTLPPQYALYAPIPCAPPPVLLTRPPPIPPAAVAARPSDLLLDSHNPPTIPSSQSLSFPPHPPLPPPPVLMTWPPPTPTTPAATKPCWITCGTTHSDSQLLHSSHSPVNTYWHHLYPAPPSPQTTWLWFMT
jgi:hypothetical protein